MKAVILCAGIGKRFGANKPKCLLKVAGKTLIQHTVETLRTHAFGDSDIYVVVGFKKSSVKRVVSRFAEPTYVENPHYSTLGNAESFRVGLEHLSTNLQETEQILLLDGDLYFHPHILGLMLRNKTDTTIAVARAWAPVSGEEVMIEVGANAQVTQIGKGVTQKPYGVAIGIYSLIMHRKAIEAFIRRLAKMSKLDYEDALNELIRRGKFEMKVVDISSLPWIDIDFKEDLERAKNTVAPKLAGAHENA